MKPEELRTLRNVLGLSRDEFSKLVGYDSHYIYLLETGRNPITFKTERQIKNRVRLRNDDYLSIISTVTNNIRG